MRGARIFLKCSSRTHEHASVLEELKLLFIMGHVSIGKAPINIHSAYALTLQGAIYPERLVAFSLSD